MTPILGSYLIYISLTYFGLMFFPTSFILLTMTFPLTLWGMGCLSDRSHLFSKLMGIFVFVGVVLLLTFALLLLTAVLYFFGGTTLYLFGALL